jgi:hypothetical protein
MSSNIQYNPALAKREKAQESADRLKRSEKVVYRIEGDDAVILSGDYNGRRISELWLAGSDERDYIFMNLVRPDPEMKKIIAKMCRD